MAGYLPRRNREEDPPARRRGRQERPSDWQYSCGLCREDHALRSCRRFRELSPHGRYEAVERRGYCRNCLARSHLAPDCPTVEGCRKCTSRHHTALHGAPQLSPALESVIRYPAYRSSVVFVPTAMVRVAEDKFDQWTAIRALLNNSTTTSKIATSTFRRLNIPSFRHHGQRFASFRIMSRRMSSTWVLKVDALVTDDLPRRPYFDPIIQDPSNDFSPNTTADPDPRCNTPIDIELGADVYHSIHRDGVLSTGCGEVQAYNSALGYVFCGSASNPFRS